MLPLAGRSACSISRVGMGHSRRTRASPARQGRLTRRPSHFSASLKDQVFLLTAEIARTMSLPVSAIRNPPSAVTATSLENLRRVDGWRARGGAGGGGGEGGEFDRGLGDAKAEADRERSYMPGDGCGDRTSAFLFQDAELAVAAGHAGLVAEPLLNVERALVLAGGLVV